MSKYRIRLLIGTAVLGICCGVSLLSSEPCYTLHGHGPVAAAGGDAGGEPCDDTHPATTGNSPTEPGCPCDHGGQVPAPAPTPPAPTPDTGEPSGELTPPQCHTVARPQLPPPTVVEERSGPELTPVQFDSPLPAGEVLPPAGVPVMPAPVKAPSLVPAPPAPPAPPTVEEIPSTPRPLTPPMPGNENPPVPPTAVPPVPVPVPPPSDRDMPTARVQQSPAMTPPTTPPAAPPPPPPAVRSEPVPAVPAKASTLRLSLRLTDGNEPRFEIRNGDELVLKVVCERVDMQSPANGPQALVGLHASGRVRFSGPNLEGTCESLTVLSASGEVELKGNVHLRCRKGKVCTDLVSDRMLYHLASSAVSVSQPIRSQEPPRAPASMVPVEYVAPMNKLSR
jgi:hypothetical protein